MAQFTPAGPLPLVALVTWQRGAIAMPMSGPRTPAPSPSTFRPPWAPSPDTALSVRARQADGSWTAAPFTRNGDQIVINATGLRSYRIAVPASAINPAQPQLPARSISRRPSHNLGGGFLEYWRAHGGLPIFGYPMTEEFSEGGYTVQYFERNRFEYHPEYAGTPYSVLLGRLGADMTAGRVFPTIPAFPEGPATSTCPHTSTRSTPAS